jgi:hypothetical protein
VHVEKTWVTRSRIGTGSCPQCHGEQVSLLFDKV